MKLTDLNAYLSLPGGIYQTLKFLCPTCQKHEIAVDIWNGKHGIYELKDSDGNPKTVKLWHGEQGPYRDWDTLSITPSINSLPNPKRDCAGWHGYITNGEIG